MRRPGMPRARYRCAQWERRPRFTRAAVGGEIEPNAAGMPVKLPFSTGIGARTQVVRALQFNRTEPSCNREGYPLD